MRTTTKASTMLEFMNIVDKTNEYLETPTSLGDVLDTFDSVVCDLFGKDLYEQRNISTSTYHGTDRYSVQIDLAVDVHNDLDDDGDPDHTLVMSYELYVKCDTLELDTLEYTETKIFSNRNMSWQTYRLDFETNEFSIGEYEHNS